MPTFSSLVGHWGRVVGIERGSGRWEEQELSASYGNLAGLRQLELHRPCFNKHKTVKPNSIRKPH